jgi:hypothetical protein
MWRIQLWLCGDLDRGGLEDINAITASGPRIVRAVRQILDSESASEKVAA